MGHELEGTEGDIVIGERRHENIGEQGGIQEQGADESLETQGHWGFWRDMTGWDMKEQGNRGGWGDWRVI